MPESQDENSSSLKKWRWLLPVFASIQLTANIVALAEPGYIVGNITEFDAKTYAQDASDLKGVDFPNDFVRTYIGLFKSFINGTEEGFNREGLVGVFGFALLSTISAGLALYYAVQICFDCCNGKCSEDCQGECAERCLKISQKIAKFAKANISSGVSDVAIAGMIPFTASDINGNYFGSSFYLTAVGAVVAFFNYFAKEMVNPKKENRTNEAERTTNDRTTTFFSLKM